MLFPSTYLGFPEELAGHFYLPCAPGKTAKLERLCWNTELATKFELDAGAPTAELLASLTGQSPLPDAKPLALAYAGHQFGYFVAQLGDGRAILLGELEDRTNTSGKRYDLQIKGSGPTPFSRGGDGYLPLAAALREHLVSQALAKLKIPTTRSLAVLLTGRQIFRPVPPPAAMHQAAILLRVAASHIRVGSFEYLAVRKEHQALRLLADYAMSRHYPQLAKGDYAGFFRAVVQSQAELVAAWLSIGFVHGVLNTDNTAISGETIDYGPCAFLDTYEANAVFSSIDNSGRYAYKRQAAILQWNLSSLGNCLAPLLHECPNTARKIVQDLLAEYEASFATAWLERMRRKLGLSDNQGSQDQNLIEEFLQILEKEQLDFTASFRSLADHSAAADSPLPQADSLSTSLAMRPWLKRWRQRLDAEPTSPSKFKQRLEAENPAIIPRNAWLEKALDEAQSGQMQLFEKLFAAVSQPFENSEHFAEFAMPPAAGQSRQQRYTTYCGT